MSTQLDIFRNEQIERQCADAMARLVCWINYSAGQHMRRWRENWGYV